VSVNLPASLSKPYPRRKDFRAASNYLLATLSEQLRGPLRWSSRQMSRGVPPTSPQQWRKGILLGPSHIGDVLYNTPALPTLRAGLPDCAWTYMVSGPSSQVLQGNPYLDEVISMDESASFWAWMARGRDVLSNHHFDVVIAYGIGSSWRDLSLAILSGIPNRVGYVHKGFSGLVTHPISICFPQPFPAYFRDLVCQLLQQQPESIPSLKPLVYPQPEHDHAVNHLSTRLGLEWGKQPVLACAVTSRQPWGVWPQEKFLKTVQYVREHENCTVVYFGAKADADKLHSLAAHTGSDTFVLAGELDLLSMVAFLHRCNVALTSDSGPRHLANAAGLPVVFIRNITFPQEEAGPYCETDHDMVPKSLELIAPPEQSTTFAKIEPADVGERIIDLLRLSRSQTKTLSPVTPLR
jgi:ADP-heptose:LPS heptosyltransferase